MGGFSKKHSAFYQYLEPFLESGNASVKRQKQNGEKSTKQIGVEIPEKRIKKLLCPGHRMNLGY